jgi:dTDP-4-dehydrorhamnose 3,5-epimerase
MTHLIKKPTQIDGAFVYQRNPISDNRGFFERLFCEHELREFGFDSKISQINFSSTNKLGIVRGLHMQTEPSLESKIVSCLKGKIFDVVVDMRKDSQTYLQSHCEILDEENRKSLVVPDGCAHGFQTLSENCELIYLHSTQYDPNAEYGVNALDETLNIQWPLSITERSERDQNLSFI